MNRGRSEAGFSLVEMLVSVVVMGIAFAAILGAIGTSVTTSGTHRAKAEGDVHLKRYAEQVKQLTYVNCASIADYTLSSFSAPGYTVSVTAVGVWNGDNPASFSPSGSGCTDKGLQRVTLQLTDSRGRVRPQETTLLKRTS